MGLAAGLDTPETERHPGVTSVRRRGGDRRGPVALSGVPDEPAVPPHSHTRR
jgi:hypothetical protein